MDKTQKEKIREFIRDIDNYVDYHGEADKEDIEPFIRKESLINFINQQFDLAIKETEERLVREILDRIKDTIGINTNSVSDNLTLVKVFDDGGLCDFVDEKEYINKVDLIRFINLLRNK